MSLKKLELEAMSLDDLWSLHEKLSAILSARIKAEKNEPEKRLAVLNRGMGAVLRSDGAPIIAEKHRREYPRVLPKISQPPDVRDVVGSPQVAALACGGDEVGPQNGRVSDWRRQWRQEPPVGVIRLLCRLRSL
ncbi:hypothetical protein [Bradyrhizobium sp.]|jgi:DNA-binding protein H-NS|uniref:hypothetical protein n=1 Tax=Bradyrhizobium sp. TaxID=376 RepID=UPI003C6F7482